MKHGSVVLFYVIVATFLVAALVFPPMTTSSAGRVSISQGHSENATWPRIRRRSGAMGREVTVPVSDHGVVLRGQMMKQNGENPLEIAGSRLPDCSHACGSCTPCRLKIVSSLCSSQSETCPISYKCLCNNKYYPVP